MKSKSKGCVTEFMVIICAGTLVGTFLYAIYYLLKSW